MSSYVLSCCSTADLSAEHLQERDIHYICFHFSLNGKEYADDLGKSISFEVIRIRNAVQSKSVFNNLLHAQQI